MPLNATNDLKDPRPFAKTKKANVSDEANWKLAKAHLKSKDFDVAKKLLTELAENDNPFREKAKKALQEINK